MTADTDANAKPKPQKKAKAASSDLLGATVIYTPTQAQCDSMRSIRGIIDPKFVGMVTLVHDDGQCSLHLFRPMNMGTVDVTFCKEGEGPNTFRVRE